MWAGCGIGRIGRKGNHQLMSDCQGWRKHALEARQLYLYFCTRFLYFTCIWICISIYGWNFSGRTKPHFDVIFFVFLSTFFGNLEVCYVKTYNIFWKYMSAGLSTCLCLDYSSIGGLFNCPYILPFLKKLFCFKTLFTAYSPVSVVFSHIIDRYDSQDYPMFPDQIIHFFILFNWLGTPPPLHVLVLNNEVADFY